MTLMRTTEHSTKNVFASLLVGLLVVYMALFFFAAASAQQESDTTAQKSTLVISDPKIKFTRYTGFASDSPLFPVQNATFQFLLVNTNRTAPLENLTMVHSGLVLKELTKYSLAPSYISANAIAVMKDNDTLQIGEEFEVPAGGTIRISYILPKKLLEEVNDNQGSYEGQLQIIGADANPIVIPVEVSFQDNPWIYSGFAVLGIVIAVVTGAVYNTYQNKEYIKSKAEDDIDIISHINGHIRSINAMRTAIDSHAWNRIYQSYNEKRSAVEKYRDRIELDDNAEAVRWFESTDELIRDKPLLQAGVQHDNNAPLDEISKPEQDDRIYKRLKETIVKDRIKEQRRQDLQDSGKWIYGAGVAIVSSIVSIFTTANLVGNTAANILIAISIGFALYRSQDLLKLIPWKTGDSS
jgi:hypothetical protein